MNILEDNKHLVFFDGEIFRFHDDSLLEQFEYCIESMDDAAEIEKNHIQAKKFNVASSLSKIFGLLN